MLNTKHGREVIKDENVLSQVCFRIPRYITRQTAFSELSVGG